MRSITYCFAFRTFSSTIRAAMRIDLAIISRRCLRLSDGASAISPGLANESQSKAACLACPVLRIAGRNSGRRDAPPYFDE